MWPIILVNTFASVERASTCRVIVLPISNAPIAMSVFLVSMIVTKMRIASTNRVVTCALANSVIVEAVKSAQI